MGDQWPYIIKFNKSENVEAMGDFAVSKDMEVFPLGEQQPAGNGMIIQLGTNR